MNAPNTNAGEMRAGTRITRFVLGTRQGRLLGFVLLGLTITSLVNGIEGAVRYDGSVDFQWGPSRAVLQHDNPYTPYLAYLDGSSDTNPYLLSQAPNYPASSYVLLWPWAALDWDAAKITWALSNVALTGLLLAGLARLIPLGKHEAILLGCLLIMGVPYRFGMVNGQHALFSLGTFVWAVILSNRGHSRAAGLLLALSWLKYTVTFPLSIFFLARRRYLPPLIAAGVHGALTVFAALWMSESPVVFFLQPIEVGSAATVAFSGSSPSLDFLGVAANLGVVVPHGVIVTVVALLAMTVLAMRASSADDVTMLSLLAVASLVLFFHRHYDRVVLVIPAAMLLVRFRPRPGQILTVVLVLVTWYVEMTFNFLMDRLNSPLSFAMKDAYYWGTVALCYAVLLVWAKAMFRGATDQHRKATDERR